MKKLLILILVCYVMSYTKPAQAIEQDKVIHFGLSFLLTTMVFGIMSQETCLDNPDGITMSCGKQLPLATRLITAAAVTLAVGFAKEGLDSRPGGTGFDWNDMAANASGMGTALMVLSW